MSPPRIALIGTSGHGLHHRRRLAPRHDSGELRIVALCDIAGVAPEPDAPIPAGAGVFTDHREMLRAARPDVVIVCTPPHTHAKIAVDVVRAGADLLLEKPPVLTAREHEELEALLAETGRACQVGFQALGSAALSRLIDVIALGDLGTITAVSAFGAWQRDDAYWSRASWAGRRELDGRPVLDGALANPFAHAVMQCLAIAGSAPVSVEVERYAARPIEVDDTATLRVGLSSGVRVLVAVTLCAEEFVAGAVTVTGTAGTATLEYPTDRLRLPGDEALREVPGRIDLLANLLAHRERPEVPLLAALARTAPFTAVLESISAAAPPQRIGGRWLTRTGGNVAVAGVNDALREAADRICLLSELNVPWIAGGTP